jgi:hypothetical protein
MTLSLRVGRETERSILADTVEKLRFQEARFFRKIATESLMDGRLLFWRTRPLLERRGPDLAHPSSEKPYRACTGNF